MPFWGVTLAHVKRFPGNHAAIEHASAFAQGTRDLFLSGPVGTGKTMIACATADDFCRRIGISGLFVRWPMTLHRLQPRNETEGNQQKLQQSLFQIPLLMIDDLAAERDEASDFTRRMSYLVYEERGDSGLRTIITSNLTLDELAKHVGDDRLTSRIAGRADVVHLSGVDQRLRTLRVV